VPSHCLTSDRMRSSNAVDWGVPERSIAGLRWLDRSLGAGGPAHPKAMMINNPVENHLDLRKNVCNEHRMERISQHSTFSL
jgi:hypothetical protein